MKYAKKINIDINFPPMTNKNKVVSQHGRISGFDDVIFVCRHIHRRNLELLRSKLPKEIQQGIISLRYCEINVVTPHSHLTDQCVINFYQKTEKEETSFWEGDVESSNQSIEDNGNGYIKNDLSKIKIVESFVAQDGDIWLLNTRQPHSVSLHDDTRSLEERFIPKKKRSRYFVQASLDIPYDDAVNYFNS